MQVADEQHNMDLQQKDAVIEQKDVDTASRAPLKAKAVEYSSGVSGSDCHGDGEGGTLALADWETA